MLTKRSHTPPREQRETSTLSIKIIQTHLQQINQKMSTITKHKSQNRTTSVIYYIVIVWKLKYLKRIELDG